MLHIKYRLAPSSIHGIGVFTDQHIPKDFCIVEASPLLDINLRTEEFMLLSETEQSEIRHHGHYDKVLNVWHVDFDMTRFANHSTQPNLAQRYSEKGYYIISLRDIAHGEELTINYQDFEVKRNEVLST